MTTIVRVTRPAELLGLIPALAGFTPRRSLVLLPFEGSRAHSALRLDLPHSGIDPHEYVAQAIALLCRIPEADAVAIAVYDEAALDETPLPWSGLVDALVDRAEACELGVVEALCVGPDAWASFLDDPGLRHPLAEIEAAPVVPGIGDVSGDQSDGVALPEVDAAERERVAQAVEAFAPAVDARADGASFSGDRLHPKAIDATGLVDDVPEFFERILESPERLEPFETAAMAWCLNRPLLRDVALVQWARNRKQGALALGAQIAYIDQDVSAPDALGRILVGGGRRPDPDRLRIALSLVRGVAARVPEAARVGPLVAAAWLSWALGRSTHASAYIAQAQEIDPDHSMAALIQAMLVRGLLPEWVFDRRRGSAR
ncbi:DUF4192 family protein [Microbacterium sp. NIBRBAC000506063]|uniref:DUF4192 family protein n=1 Tax=Microbacterium sp. NIBRBAC000506063 TaxID=2734618 RepID=UPI001BB54A78|nr:DUF4192 family protein [Microbacterium sp. NIBRBAC000506063]QTV80172.1 DUF4192 family protein [Microbacterium sp. NIBRBAC000506063]